MDPIEIKKGEINGIYELVGQAKPPKPRCRTPYVIVRCTICKKERVIAFALFKDRKWTGHTDCVPVENKESNLDIYNKLINTEMAKNVMPGDAHNNVIDMLVEHYVNKPIVEKNKFAIAILTRLNVLCESLLKSVDSIEEALSFINKADKLDGSNMGDIAYKMLKGNDEFSKVFVSYLKDKFPSIDFDLMDACDSIDSNDKFDIDDFSTFIEKEYL